MLRFRERLFTFGWVASFVAGSAMAGPAINQFEVKDLQSSPGDFEFQSQNAWSAGQPTRRARIKGSSGPVFDDNTVTRQREAQEIQLGITDWFRVRIGIEFEQERLDDPAALSQADAFSGLKLQELALEGVVVFVKPKPEGVGLGLLVEYGNPVSGDVESPGELFAGPIIEAHTGPWSLIGNFAFVTYFGGHAAPGDTEFRRDRKIDFSYFLQGKYDIGQNWAVALESYGTIDRLGHTGTRSEASRIFGDFDQHRAGPVFYYTYVPDGSGRVRGPKTSLADDDVGQKELSVTVGAGPLFGFNGNTPDITYKLSIEVDY